MISTSSRQYCRPEGLRVSGRGGLLVVLALLWGCALVATEVTAPFRGPTSAHIAYDHTRDAATYGTEMQFGFVDPDGAWNVLLEAAGTRPAVLTLSGSHHARDVEPGTYQFQIRQREAYLVWVKVPGTPGYYIIEWNDWQALRSVTVEINGGPANGTMLFDETLTNVMVDDVIVPTGKRLTLRGTIDPPPPPTSGADPDGTITVHGELDSNGVVFGWRRNAGDFGYVRVQVDVHAVGSFSGMTYARFTLRGANSFVAGCSNSTFEVHAPGVSFANCTGGMIVPYQGAAIVGVQDTLVGLWGLEDDAVATISDSTIRIGTGTILAGQIVLDNVTCNDEVTFGGDCEVDANRVDFKGGVVVGSDDPTAPIPEVLFHSRNSRFAAMRVVRAAPTNVSVTDGLFRGAVEVIGGYPDFLSCEFGGGIGLINRTGAKFDGCLFLSTIVPSFWRHSTADAPFWDEAAAPVPIITNNAFMGQYGYAGGNLYGAVGANYYGDSEGWRDGNHGFLGYHSGHAGARLLMRPPHPQSAPPLTTSPLALEWRRDTRVFPRFWMNGIIVGQNTISHAGLAGNTAGRDGMILKGRPTLVSVDVIASDNNLQGVRVYAKWNGEEIDALPRGPLHRDRSRYSNNQVRLGKATYSIILPATATDHPGTILSLPLEVYLDASLVMGFSPESYPTAHQRLFTGDVEFNDPPGRPLKIHVQPIQVRHTLGFSWGIPSTSGVIKVLQSDMPDMLPLRAADREISLFPIHTHFSSTALFTNRILLVQIAASLSGARWLTEKIGGEVPDFVVVVLSKSIASDFDGVVMMRLNRVIFVAENKADAVLHELGHGIGLNLDEEQYDLFPPNGMRVQRVTKFPPENVGRLPVEHLAGEQDFWHDSADYLMDIMGRIGPLWTASSTVRSFHEWFKINLAAPSDKAVASPAQAPAPNKSARRVLLSGAVDAAGSLDPDSLTAFDVTALGVPPEPAASSGDASRAYRLQAFFYGLTVNDTTFYLPEGDPLWMATFDLHAATEVYTITRVHDGKVVFRAQRAELVQTRFLSPSAGAVVGPRFEAEWSAETAPGADLQHVRHAILYKTSPDGAWNWAVMPTRETQISDASSFLPETDTLALRLITSDGVRSVEHVIEGLSVVPRAPRVTILSPRHGDRAVSETLWELAATAEEVNGAVLDAGSWTSSLDGPLGSGLTTVAILSPGQHTLRYETTRAKGLSGSAEVSVTVEDAVAELDLGLEEADLILQNHETTPEGLGVTRIVPGTENTFLVTVRNQGTEASARVEVFVQAPFADGMHSIGTETITMEAFDTGTATFRFVPEQEGTYRVRAVLDNVVPTDPNHDNNTGEWLFSTTPSGEILVDGNGRVVPALLWPAPGPIAYGTPLTAAQLNAAAEVAGVFTYDPPAGTVLPAGSHTLTADFAPDDAATWAAAPVSTTIDVLPAPLTITAHDQLKTYGQTVAFAGTEITCDGLVGADTVTSVQIDSAGAAPTAGVAGSPYAIIPSQATGNGLDNYVIDYLNGDLAVEPAPLTCRAEDQQRAVGTANPVFTIAYEGLMNGDAAPAVPPVATCVADAASPLGTYPIVLSDGNDPNYALSLQDGTLTVHPASYAITFHAGDHGSLAGGAPTLILDVPHGAAAPQPPPVWPAYGWALTGWAPALPPLITAVAETTAQYAVAGAVAPDGAFVGAIAAAAAAAGRGWWNLTGRYLTTVAGMPLTLNLIHDTQGRLTGTAACTTAPNTILAMRLTGTVKGAGHHTVAQIALRGTSPARTATAALTLNLTLDAPAARLVGTIGGTIRNGASTTRTHGTLVLATPAGMDGTWALRLNLDEGIDAITGNATLTLSNGVNHAFTVRGQSNLGGSATLSLLGTPSDPPAATMTIRTTITPLDGGWADLDAFSARGYGQTVLW